MVFTSSYIMVIGLSGVQFSLLLFVLTITILIGQEPPAYFENSRDFVDKHDYSIICYPIICADYTVRSTQCASLAKERES